VSSQLTVVKDLQMNLVELEPGRELDQEQQLLIYVALQVVILQKPQHSTVFLSISDALV
jgi:hypothetical protein